MSQVNAESPCAVRFRICHFSNLSFYSNMALLYQQVRPNIVSRNEIMIRFCEIMTSDYLFASKIITTGQSKIYYLWGIVILGFGISLQNLVSQDNEGMQITGKYWIWLRRKLRKRSQQEGHKRKKTTSSCTCSSLVYMQNWKYADWCSTFRPITFAECLNFMTVCHHGCHWLSVYTV